MRNTSKISNAGKPSKPRSKPRASSKGGDTGSKNRTSRIPCGRGYLTRTVAATWQAELNHNDVRHRRTFRTRAQAEAWIVSTTAALDGLEMPLTPRTQRDAREAVGILPPGVSLADAARAYTATHHAGASVTVQEAVERFLASKHQSGLRPASLTSVTGRVSRLLEPFGEQPLDAVTPGALLEWLDGEALAPVNRNNQRGALRDFWGWCIKMDLTETDPTTAITTARTDETLPAILPVDAVARLMTACEQIDRGLIAYHALGFFAGLRTGEILRLTGRAIGLPKPWAASDARIAASSSAARIPPKVARLSSS